MTKEIIFWGIHAGRNGEAEPLFEKESVVALGWKKTGDLSNFKTREEFRQQYEQAYPQAKAGAIPIHAGILYRFVCEMKNGDVIVFPRKFGREISIGRVIGEYKYESQYDYPHIRKVEWFKKYPRTKFSQGALYEIGAAMTFFQVKNFSEEFAVAIEQKEFMPVAPEEEESVGLAADDIEQQSHDFVLKQINQKLKGHALAEFVGHLLNLMGYKTKVSEPGPDRGIDIIAHKDDLGVEPPTILVQVKSSEKDINEAAVSELYGKVSEKDFGLFISVGGFNKQAINFAFDKRNLKLINGDELVDLVYKYYDQLDGKYKAVFPLKKVFIPETLAE